MNKMLVILKHEFLTTVKRKSFIAMTLGFPLLVLVIILGYQAIQGNTGPSTPQTVKIGYVDQTGSFDQNTSQPYAIFISQPDEAAAKSSLLSGNIDEYIVIPENYLATGLVTRYSLDREIETSGSVYQAISAFLIGNMLGDKADSQVITRVQNPLALSSITLDESGDVAPVQGGLTAFIVPYIFSILLMMSIFTASGYLLQGLGEEKENRVMEILLSSVSTGQLITGKVLGLGAAGLAQILIWFVSARLLAGMASSTIGGVLSTLQISNSFLILGLTYFILGYFLFAIIMAGAGAIGANARESQQFSVIFTMMVAIPFFFITSIIENPNGIIAQVLTFVPFTSPVASIIRLGVTDIPVWQLAVSFILLLITIVGMFLLAAKIFRVFLLMYGKTPRFGEVFRYLRQA
jgi:ABC-2 type transport system permease protein